MLAATLMSSEFEMEFEMEFHNCREPDRYGDQDMICSGLQDAD